MPLPLMVNISKYSDKELLAPKMPLYPQSPHIYKTKGTLESWWESEVHPILAILMTKKHTSERLTCFLCKNILSLPICCPLVSLKCMMFSRSLLNSDSNGEFGIQSPLYCCPVSLTIFSSHAASLCLRRRILNYTTFFEKRPVHNCYTK